MKAGPGTLEAVLEQTGLTYRRLDYWTRQGYLRPADPRPGSGGVRVWPAAEVRVARTLGRLVDAGIRPDVAARVARSRLLDRPLGPGITVRVQEVGP